MNTWRLRSVIYGHNGWNEEGGGEEKKGTGGGWVGDLVLDLAV